MAPMKRCKVFPGYTNFYTYRNGDKTILLKRTRHAQGSKVIHRQDIEFGSPVKARRYFDTECGA